MADVKYTIRNMVKDEVPKAMEIYRQTGMNKGIDSLYVWLEVDPDAFKIAVTDDGEIIGVCAAPIHHEDLAFLGFYCVKEEYRGRGIGFKVWNACLEHIAHRNACLTAFPEKAKLYQERGGFPIVQSKWFGIEYEWDLPLNVDKLSDLPPKGVHIEKFEEMHLPLIYDYDTKLIGYDRKLAIKLSCKQPDSRTQVAVKDNECVGFGTIKISCQTTPIIGPLYADDKEIAEVLLKKLLLSLPQSKGLWMFTLSQNDAANELVKRIGCLKSKIFCFLYRNRPVDNVDQSKIYGLLDDSFSPW